MLATTLTACIDRYPTSIADPTTLTPGDIISIARDGADDPVRVGTTDVAVLSARLPGAATQNLIKFTTSAGTFALTGTREVSLRAVLDTTDAKGRLVARVALRADTAAFAIVSATIADYRDTVRVQFAR